LDGTVNARVRLDREHENDPGDRAGGAV